MNKGQMKNIVVLKDLESNIVDEAIVILKNNSNIKKKETIENKNNKNLTEGENSNYDFVVKEAENIINEYIKAIEKPKDNKNNMSKLAIKYKKLQISSILLGITSIIGIIMCLVN